jgi:hypothetical protein
MHWNAEIADPVATGVLHLQTPISNKLRILIAAVAVALVTVAPASSAPAVPSPIGPPDGADVVFLPAFAWQGVTGADKYQFQLSADPNFNSSLFNITTRNTRATPEKTVPNGTYFWRVSSVDAAGAVSNWSPVMSVVKLWADRPTLSSPADGATITYPADPLVLRWTAVPGAAKYRVFLARDSALGSLVTSDGKPWEVQATNLASNVLLSSNTYYWAVTPLDAQGNPGDQSPIRSFTWTWPSTTTPAMTDLAPSTEHIDPQFSWDPVPGAARYEVEVNSDFEFDPASKVCCVDKPISTTLTPLEVFYNNTYYWRVRAIDRASNAGVWNEGEPFVKRFDNYPDLSEDSIKNLHMRDAGDPGTDLDLATPGYQTDDPILTWDPVPGAASYQVDVVPFEVVNAGDPAQCNWTASGLRRWTVPTASTAWTPLNNAAATPPFSSGESVSRDGRGLVPGESYCARVRARSGRVTLFDEIWGDYTFLGNGGSEPSFTFTNFPAGGPCSDCYAGYLGLADYTLPIRGETLGANPLFTWKPIAGKQSYWVIVAKDPSFSTIIDYAITRIPAYAVRTRSAPRTYDDELTSYYWVVLPATATDGDGAPGNPAFGAYADFHKQTTPPALLAPDNGASFAGQPTFEWASIFGARRYHIQVDDETTFSSPLDDKRTASTAFTSLETYESARTYYWRVAAEDENNKGLTWSATRSFQIALPAPVMSTADFGTGEAPPVISWSPVPGAVSYTLDVQEPDGDHTQWDNFPSTASSWQKMTGVGIMTLKVRAHFPTASTFSTIAGPWSAPSIFTHIIREPGDLTSDAGQNRLLLSWAAKTGMKQYKVQLSLREDFSPYIENKVTDNPRFAPTLMSSSYTNGGTFWWRVAAVDADGNAGDWATRTVDLPPLASSTPPPTTLKTFRLSAKGYPVKNRYRTIYIYVKDSATLAAVRYASVRASGAGVTATTKLTNSLGVAKFYLKATRYPGTVTFKVTRSGYTTKYLYRKVRLP